MKKTILFIIAIFALIGSANANKDGFIGPQAGNLKTTTVKEVYKLYDDTQVVMQGKIINSLGDEKYTFSDKTGEITVEIDNEDWNGLTITPETNVQIYGEVDKGIFKHTKIDVDSINIRP